MQLSVHDRKLPIDSFLEYSSIVKENLATLLIGNHLNIIELYYRYICLYGMIHMDHMILSIEYES